jgi:hypothetical protein
VPELRCGSLCEVTIVVDLSRLDIRTVSVVVPPTMLVEVAAAVIIIVRQIPYFASATVVEMIGVIGRFGHFSARWSRYNNIMW